MLFFSFLLFFSKVSIVGSGFVVTHVVFFEGLVGGWVFIRLDWYLFCLFKLNSHSN